MDANTVKTAYEAYHNAEKEFYRLRASVKADLLNAIAKMPTETRVNIEDLIKVTGLTEKTLFNFLIRINSIDFGYEGKVRTYALIKEDGTVDTDIVKTETEKIPYIIKLSKVTQGVDCTKDERSYCPGYVYSPNQGNGDEILRLLSVDQ